MDNLNVGDVVRLRSVFTVLDVNTDPTTITLEVQSPSGTTTSYTYAGAQITREGTGIYYYNLSVNEAGWWVYQWTGTGTVEVVQGNRILVKESLL
jgi:hypothetical protein